MMKTHTAVLCASFNRTLAFGNDPMSTAIKGTAGRQSGLFPCAKHFYRAHEIATEVCVDWSSDYVCLVHV